MRSLSSLAETLGTVLRYGGLYAALFLLMALSCMAVPFPFSGPARAPYVLMAVYYLAVYRPSAIPVWFVFAIGMALDFIGGLPLGLQALVLVIMRWVVTDQRRFLLGQSFAVLWLVFCIILVISSLMQWALFSLTADFAPPSMKPLWYADALGAVLFPAVCAMLHFVLKLLPVPPGLDRDSSNLTHERLR